MASSDSSSDEGLNDRVVLVTGATGGIGRAVAHALTAEGARVAVMARTAGPLDELANMLDAVALPGDCGDPTDMDRVREQLDGMGGAYAVVNAAGTFDLAAVAETDVEMFDRMVHGNLRGPFVATRALLPGMLERGSGHVVTIGSVAGRVAFPGNGAYSASKFGVRGLHEVLHAELRGTGVRATLVEPAATDTGIWDPLGPDQRDDLPGRDDMLAPDAVAKAVLFALTRPPSVAIPTVAVQRS